VHVLHAECLRRTHDARQIPRVSDILNNQLDAIASLPKRGLEPTNAALEGRQRIHDAAPAVQIARAQPKLGRLWRRAEHLPALGMAVEACRDERIQILLQRLDLKTHSRSTKA